jgi:DNA-binding SARP family transcriptional activator
MSRPSLDLRILVRARLAQRLPESPGHTVWLQAPYGYGKSVLAAQWADELEAQGWRVLWLTPVENSLKAGLANLLDLPLDLPWAGFEERLWQHPTLLVLDDLPSDSLSGDGSSGGGFSGAEELGSLIRRNRGLLLVSSRRDIAHPELMSAHTRGRLTHLSAADLAFTPDETEMLFDRAEDAHAAWSQARGWPLPLHWASLTGETPSVRALLPAVRESLAESEWDEFLFLSALDDLPKEAATAATQRLAAALFVQELEASYRLHALPGEGVLADHQGEVARVVGEQAHRLPILLRARAFERVGLLDALAELLEREGLAIHDPAAVLHWDTLAPGPRGPLRRQQVGYALCLTQSVREGIAELLAAAALPEANANQRLLCYAQAVWYLVSLDPDQARDIKVLGETLVDQADPDIAGQFLANSHFIAFKTGDWAEAEAACRRALEYLSATSPRRHISVGNMAIARWHATGDLEGLLVGRGEALVANRRSYPSNVPGDLLQLAGVRLFLGQRHQALELLGESKEWARAHPKWALWADALHAHVAGDLPAFPTLSERGRAWEDPATEDWVVANWAKTLRERGAPQQALTRLEQHEGFEAAIERALAHLGLNDRDAALGALPPQPTRAQQRERRLRWQAARYRITRDPADLDALLELTLVGERILPGLVPLQALPPERPELASAYPLDEVLDSRWKAAISLRLPEVPPLQVTALGPLEIRHRGARLRLQGRLAELFMLLLLNLSRNAIGAAMWPDASSERVSNSLSVQHNALRKVLEPWGVPTYLKVGRLVCTEADVWSLEEALQREDAARVEALYRQPLAPEFDLEPVRDARERLHEQVVRLLTQSARGAPEETAERYLQRVMALDPLNEAALHELLSRLVARGRRVEAATRFRQFEARLHDELGLAPLESTRQLIA